MFDRPLAPLTSAKSTSPDADLIYREFRFAGHTLRHACYRALLALGRDEKSRLELAADMDEILVEHEAIWLARNRPGGLKDSSARFKKAKTDYLA